MTVILVFVDLRSCSYGNIPLLCLVSFCTAAGVKFHGFWFAAVIEHQLACESSAYLTLGKWAQGTILCTISSSQLHHCDLLFARKPLRF